MAKRRRKKKINKKAIVIAVMALASSAAGYVFAPTICSFCCDVVDKAIKSSGFVVESINISGTNSSTETLVRTSLSLNTGDNIFKLSSNEIYDNIKKISWVKQAVVRKILPNTIDINVESKIPMAVFQHDSIFTLVDENGEFIENLSVLPQTLPIITGKNANLKFASLLNTISKYELVKKNLSSMTFVRERRWDIYVCGGIQVKLPDENLTAALDILSKIIDKNKFSGRNVESIDLRIKDNTIIKGLKVRKTNENMA